MNLVRWNPLDESFPSFPSLLENFFGGDGYSRALTQSTSVPAVNVKENEDSFIVSLAIPGVKKEDCKITVDNGIMTVSGEHKHEVKADKDKYSRYEYNYSSFARSFSIPTNADGDNVKAKYENGELLITLPKKEKSLPQSKHIAIE